MKCLVLSLFLVSLGSVVAAGQKFGDETRDCGKWHSKVIFVPPVKRTSDKPTDQPIGLRLDQAILSSEIKVDEKTFLEAAECFIALEGNGSISRLQGATRPDVSQTFGPARVDVAALYYIGYLFLERWDHGSAIYLSDKFERPESKRAAVAFESYKTWLKEVRRIGVKTAREKKLDPLAGTGLSWY